RHRPEGRRREGGRRRLPRAPGARRLVAALLLHGLNRWGERVLSAQPDDALAPRTRSKVPAVPMVAVGRARPEVFFRYVQCLRPGLAVGPDLGIGVPALEAAQEQI